MPKVSFVSKSLLLLVITHLITDMTQGAIPVLIPFLKDSFSLTYTQVGIIVLVLNFTSSITQPLFGYITDKVNLLWILPLGLLVAGVGFSLIGVMTSYYTLLLVIFISGMGVSCFHPQALKLTYLISKPEARGRGIGLFSVGGNAGFALGSITASYVYHLSGTLASTLYYLPLYVIMAVASWLYFKNAEVVPAKPKAAAAASAKSGFDFSANYKIIATILLFIFFRSTTQAGLLTYIPLYFITFLEENPIFAGYVLSAFLLTGAFGTFIGASLSDRLGRKTVIIGSMTATIPLLIIFPHSSGIAALVVIGLIGLALPASMATMTVLCQELMPNNVGMAAALSTGFTLGLGGIGVLILGLVADEFGLLSVFTVLSALPVVAVAIACLLPARPRASQGAKGA